MNLRAVNRVSDCALVSNLVRCVIGSILLRARAGNRRVCAICFCVVVVIARDRSTALVMRVAPVTSVDPAMTCTFKLTPARHRDVRFCGSPSAGRRCVMSISSPEPASKDAAALKDEFSPLLVSPTVVSSSGEKLVDAPHVAATETTRLSPLLMLIFITLCQLVNFFDRGVISGERRE